MELGVGVGVGAGLGTATRPGQAWSWLYLRQGSSTAIGVVQQPCAPNAVTAGTLNGERCSPKSARGPHRMTIRYFAGNPVANTPRNGHRMVAETLVIAADQSGVHGRFHAM